MRPRRLARRSTTAARGRQKAGQLVTARRALIVAGLLVSAAFMWIAVRGAHPAETLDSLRRTEPAPLLAALVLLCVAFGLRAVRWWSLFDRTGRPPFRHVVSALFLGYLLNALLPVRAGEAAAVISLNRRAGTPLAEGAATMFVQRAQDVLSLVLLLFLMVPWLPDVSWLRAAGVLGVALTLALALTALVVLRFGERPLRVLLSPLRWLPLRADAVERAPGQLLRGLTALRSPRVALVSFGWTTLSWLVLGASFWLVLEASGIDVSPLAGELVVIAIGLAMILPSSPAAIGVFEGATVIALSAYGVSGSVALSYALVLHALNVVPLLVVGAVLVLRRRLRRREAAAARASETEPAGA